MSDDDLRKYAPRMSSVLRHVDPKFVNERKARALGPGETAGEETLADGAAPEGAAAEGATQASPWGKEAPAPLAVDPKLLPSAFAPREEPDTLNDGLVTPVEPAVAVRGGGQKRVWVAALLVGFAAVVVAVGLWSRGGVQEEREDMEAIRVAAPVVSGSAEVPAVASVAVPVAAPEVTAPVKAPEPEKVPEVGKAAVPTPTQPTPAPSGIVPELY